MDLRVCVCEWSMGMQKIELVHGPDSSEVVCVLCPKQRRDLATWGWMQWHSNRSNMRAIMSCIMSLYLLSSNNLFSSQPLLLSFSLHKFRKAWLHCFSLAGVCQLAMPLRPATSWELAIPSLMRSRYWEVSCIITKPMQHCCCRKGPEDIFQDRDTKTRNR